MVLADAIHVAARAVFLLTCSWYWALSAVSSQWRSEGGRAGGLERADRPATALRKGRQKLKNGVIMAKMGVIRGRQASHDFWGEAKLQSSLVVIVNV